MRKSKVLQSSWRSRVALAVFLRHLQFWIRHTVHSSCLRIMRETHSEYEFHNMKCQFLFQYVWFTWYVMGLCSLKKQSYSPSKSRVCCFRLKSKSQAKLARSISTLNKINASIIILQKSTHVSLSYMQKSPHTSPPRPHWLQTAKGQLETSLEWEIWMKLLRSSGIFFIIHKLSIFKEIYHNFK